MYRRPAPRFSAAACLAAGVLLAGCAAQPVPAEEVARARGAVAAATLAALPGGTAEADSAQRKLALSQRLIASRDHGPARWLVEQAEVDAELATARLAARQATIAAAERGTARASLRNMALPR